MVIPNMSKMSHPNSVNTTKIDVEISMACLRDPLSVLGVVGGKWHEDRDCPDGVDDGEQ